MLPVDTAKTVVFVTPALPSLRGNGLVMRAAATLKLLSRWAGNVHVVVVPIYPSMSAQPEPAIREAASSWQIIDNPHSHVADSGVAQWQNVLRGAVPTELRSCNADWQQAIKHAIAGLKPDLVFVFRFYLVPFILPSIGSTVPFWLDVDELESSARERLANLYAEAKHDKEAIARMESSAYEQLEREHLKSFARLFASSQKECAHVLKRCPGADVRVMQNVYPFIVPQQEREDNGCSRLLFVGSFGYYPNQDGLQYFARQILPIVRQTGAMTVKFAVVGSGLITTHDMSAYGLEIVGQVADTTPYYADCDAVVVPLRAGAGTRIKILEAFSHGRAVISTSIGAEGLGVNDGEHLLIADQPRKFAEYCLRLIHSRQERTELAKNGHQFFLEHHSLPKLEESVSSLFH